MIIGPLYNDVLQKKGLLIVIKNLTEYKLEERRQHKQQADIALASRISIMGEMASAFAHEINQPLTALVAYSCGSLKIIKNQSYNFDAIYEKLSFSLEQIALQAEHVGNIIHNMKDYMYDNELHVEATNVNELIKDTLSILNYELLDFNLNITLDLADDLPLIQANKINLMQVLLNLTRNSIEALQNMNQVDSELNIKTIKLDHCIEVHVIDNGPGILEEFKDKILTNYFTTKPQGTGIGLGICRSLIEAHGGKLSVRYQRQRGAWFSFTLPFKNKLL